MKKFLLNFLGFGLFATPFYVGLLFWWGQKMEPEDEPNLSYVAGGVGNLHERLKEAKGSNGTDLLFLGSSHAYRGFDVRIFRRQGIRAFNLGSSSQTPLQTAILLQRYLKRLHPKFVVYAVDPSVFSVDGAESAIDLIANDRKDYRTTLMALRLSNIMVYNTLVYATLMDRINTSDSFRKKPNMQADTYVAGGFVSRTLSYYQPQSHTPASWSIRGYQLRAFEEVLREIRSSGAQYLLLFPPITTPLYQSYQGNEAFDQRMKDYGPYYNFNKILHLTDTLHFYDDEHLNSRGVQVFNEKLLEILFREGYLKR